MIRISPLKPHTVDAEGLKVHLEGSTSIALTSPEAQRFVFNYVKSAGLGEYGMNKFVQETESSDPVFTSKGYWLLLPSQWNRTSVRV
jgi:hypothetical protein